MELAICFISAGAIVVVALLKDWWTNRTILRQWTFTIMAQRDLLDRVMHQSGKDYAWLEFRRQMEKTQVEAETVARVKFATQSNIHQGPSDDRLDVTSVQPGTEIPLPSHGGV